MPNIESTNSVSIERLFYEISKDWFEKNGYEFVSPRRSEIYTAALVVWLSIFQRISGMPLQGAAISVLNSDDIGFIAKLNTSSKKIKFGNVSTNSGGFSQAKSRLEEEKIVDLVKACFEKLAAKTKQPKNAENDLNIFLVDGTCFTTSYTADNILTFKQTSAGEKGKLHFPRLRVVTANSLETGLAVKPEFGEITESEQALTWKIILSLPEDATVMGDRNFGVFSVAYRVISTGRDVLFRMNEAVFNRIVGEQSGERADILATWKPSKQDLKTTPEIPEAASVEGRFIKITVKKNGFRPEAIYYFTTLKISAQKISELYLKRQRIETNIRQLKEFLKLEFINAKNPDMIKKEIYFGFLAFNLVTAIMYSVAKNIKLEFSRISFTAALRLILAFAPRINNAKTPEKIKDLFKKMETAFYQTKIAQRKNHRSFPREVKRNKSKFPLNATVSN